MTAARFNGECDELGPVTSAYEDLVALIEGHVDLEGVHVANLTRRFLAELRASQPIGLDLAAEFLALAARVLLHKSGQLLAVPESVDQSPDEVPRHAGWLDRRLLQIMAEGLAGREGYESFAPFVPPVAVQRRLEPREPNLLLRAWTEMMARSDAEPAPVHVPAFVRLEAAVSGLIRHLRSSVRVQFRRLLERGTRDEAVLHFLAVLELIRRRQASVTQDDLFQEITIEYIERDANATAKAG